MWPDELHGFSYCYEKIPAAGRGDSLYPGIIACFNPSDKIIPMKLYEFLTENREQIFILCREKVAPDDKHKTRSELLEQGLPLFYSELIAVLTRTQTGNKIDHYGATSHGKESLRLGYSISQVVNAYGAICQSITELAQTKDVSITVKEFQQLNLSLDIAVAEAVTEYQKVRDENVSDEELKRLGYMIHELRNTLVCASLSYRMMQKGQVGTRGSTSQVLSDSLERMSQLMDRGLAEVRLSGKYPIEETELDVFEMITEVEVTTMLISGADRINLVIEAGTNLKVMADRHLLLSALSNLIQNAVKFTRPKGTVYVRAKEVKDRILIEVEDQCGGLPEGKIEELFRPFVQKGVDKSGLGLGLALSRRAALMCHGGIYARDIPARGCVFTIDLPKMGVASVSS